MNVQDRINQFAEWFGVETLQLANPDDPLLDDNIIEWCLETGASIDWIVCGDPKSMAADYRKNCLTKREFMESVNKMSDGESTALGIVMKGAIDGHFTLEDGLKVWLAECSKHRDAA